MSAQASETVAPSLQPSSRQVAEQLYEVWFRPALAQTLVAASDDKLREISDAACAEKAAALQAEFLQHMLPSLQAQLELPAMRAEAADIIATQLLPEEAAHYLEQPWMQQADQEKTAFIMTLGLPALSKAMLAVMNAPLLDAWGKQMDQVYEREFEQPLRALCHGEDLS